MIPLCVCTMPDRDQWPGLGLGFSPDTHAGNVYFLPPRCHLKKKGSMWSTEKYCLLDRYNRNIENLTQNIEDIGEWRMEEYLSTEILAYFHLANLPGTPPKVSSIPFFHMEKKSRLSVSSSGLLFTTSECFSMVKVSVAGSWGGATLSDPSFRPNCTSCYSAG